MNIRSQSHARFKSKYGSRLACGLTALSLTVSSILAATPAAAATQPPSPETTTTEPAAGPAEIPTTSASPEPAADPASLTPEDPSSLDDKQPVPSEAAAAESAGPEPTPATKSDKAIEAEVEVPVEELSQDQLLELLKVLQGKHGAEMGSGLEQRQERVDELAEPEVREELDQQLEVLDIDRTSTVQPVAALPALNRDKWSPDGIQGIDVSSHQQSVNWQTEWNYGARFAYVKSTEALSYMNPYWESQYTGSYRQGLIRGSYHFAIPNVSSGKTQANYFVNNGGGWSADGKTLPPLLDIEYNPYPELGNTCYNMSASKMVAWIKEFSDTIKARTGRLPAIYSTADWWNHCTGNSTAFKNHPLHIAHYAQVASPSLPAGWTTYRIWQYSSTGPFVGDSNVWNGTMTSLRNFAYNVSSTSSQTTSVKQDYTVPGDLNGDGRGDLVSRRTDGSLWFYPGNGSGGYGSARKIGSGWQVLNQLVGAGDLNGDGRADLVGRNVNGTLWFYAGTGSGSFKSRVQIGTSTGWTQYTEMIGTGDLNGDGRGDMLAKGSDGKVYFYAGRGTGQFASRLYIASGWQAYSQLVAPRDFTGDGKADVVARKPDGTLWLLRGTGRQAAFGSLFGSAEKIGSSGWQKFTTVLGAWDNNKDRKNDLLAVSSDKSLRFYAGTQMKDSSGMKPMVQTGSDIWDSYSEVITPGDFNGDGKADLIGRKSNGEIWFAAGNGKGGYGSRVRIGYGWQVYNLVFGVGDYNRDGKNDLLARHKDGSLWFYAGTGKVGSGNEGYKRRVKIGTSGWNQFSRILGAGDVNRDGRRDLIAVRPDGTAWLYAGPGNGQHGQRTRIATGWNKYSYLTAAGDYTGDGTADVIARKPDGTLWLLEGRKAYSSGWFTTERKIGSSGWNIFNRITGPGDFTSDKKVDLLATKPDGTMWRYDGTRFVNSGLLSYRPAGQL